MIGCIKVTSQVNWGLIFTINEFRHVKIRKTKTTRFSAKEIKIMTDLITEKLTKIGIEPIIAIEQRAYGQDIFCIKICGKIIESQFCIVILDDTVEQINGANVLIPNPNVYYEYGLMTALGKHVIPLQKDGQDLAFNIQTRASSSRFSASFRSSPTSLISSPPTRRR